MQKNVSWGKVFGYGFLLYIIWNVVLFVLSMFFHFEINPPAIAIALESVVMAGITYGGIRIARPANRKAAFVYSIGWTLIVYGLLLLVTIGNDTTSVIFSNWGTYLGMILMPIVPLFMKTNK